MINDHPSSEMLLDYVHGELPAHQDAAVHAHLAVCSSCSGAYDEEMRLGELLRAHARAEERELPPGFGARVIAAATASPPARAWWQAPIFRPAYVLPAAAGIVLALYLGFSAFGGPAKTTTVGATYYIESHAALATDAPFAEGASLPVSFAANDDAAESGTNDGH
jgi:anti-sigma factor RsiW